MDWLVERHYSVEKELKYLNKKKLYTHIDNIEVLETRRDALWTEIESRLEMIPDGVLLAAIDGTIQLHLR